MKMILIIYVLFVGASVNAKSLNLDSLIKLAKENHYGLKADKDLLEASRLEKEVLKSKFYPKIGFEAGKELIKATNVDESENTAAIYGEINLFNGFKDLNELSKYKLDGKLLESKYKSSEFNLSLYVEHKFYDFLTTRKKIEILSREIKRVRYHSKLVKKQYKSKLITETDYLEFLLEQKKLQSRSNSLKLKMDQLLNELVSLTGSNQDQLESIKGEVPHLKIKSNLNTINTLAKHSPTYLEHENHKKVESLNKKIAKSGWAPSIYLKAEHGRLDEVETGISSNETSSRIALTATWELFSGFETSSKVKSSKLKTSSALNSGFQALRDQGVTLEKYFNTLKMLEKTIEFEEENEILASKLYKNTLKEYQKGVKDSGALANANGVLSDAQNRIYELKENYIHTKLKLEKLLGQKLEFEVFEHKRKI